MIDKNEYECLCNNFTKNLEESKSDFFKKYEHSDKIKFFSHNKLQFNIEPRS